MGSGNTCKVANDTFMIKYIIVTKVVTRVSYLQLKVVIHVHILRNNESGNT